MFICAYKDGQHIDYRSILMNRHWIMQVGTLIMNYVPLIFHWQFVETHLYNNVAMLWHAILLKKAAKSANIDECNQTALGLFQMQVQELLMLQCHSYSRWGTDCVACHCTNNAARYIVSGGMLQCGQRIVEFVWRRIILTGFALNFNTSKQSSHTQ